jgi:putative effector of murein hydrolase LrgA (UPF0299 family)
LALLLIFQTLGEALARIAHVPLPGPVIGLIALLPCFTWEAVRGPVGACADLLLRHLSLLFVPVGVGVISHLHLIAQFGPGLLVAVIVSTWVGLAVTSLVLAQLARGDKEGDTA